jgi:hypothetical protein
MEGRVGVFDSDIVLGDLLYVLPYDLGERLALFFGLLPVPSSCTFHLMEHGVMASVDGIASVDIRADKVALTFVVAKCVGLVC